MSIHIQREVFRIDKTKPLADFLIEVSWEVCNKVGGIYTVLMSKAARMMDYYDGHYLLIGPYFANKTAGIFLEEMPPPQIKKALEQLKDEGIEGHYGKWLIQGEPKVILIDFSQQFSKVNDIKKWLWDNYQVDSLRASFDYDEPVVWSICAGKAIEQLAASFGNKTVVAHFHEWLSGPGLLYLKNKKVDVKTVFMTHATILGRTLASNGVDLYCPIMPGKRKCALEAVNPLEEARKYFIESKYSVEYASAHHADVFATVSEITNLEAGLLLKKKADVLLPNGLDIEKFPTFEEASIKHRALRNRIRDFVMYHFFPYYTFNLEDTLFFFLAGRYEFRDKGIDVYIKALSKLNQELKSQKSPKTVVAFIFVPTGTKGVKPLILENKTNYNDIKESLEQSEGDIEKNVLNTVIAERKMSEKTVLGDEVYEEVKRKILRFKKKGIPPLSTHDLFDDNDAILRACNEEKLNNTEEDRVKIVFYPIYLNGADGLLDIDYYESMLGCHLGVFPSYYEPWGYTPLEAAALGVSSVTTDLAGFGRFLLTLKTKKKTPGIFVLKRINKTDEEIVKDLADFMLWFTSLGKQDRVQNKIEAKHLSGHADWKILIDNYIQAHNLAFRK